MSKETLILIAQMGAGFIFGLWITSMILKWYSKRWQPKIPFRKTVLKTGGTKKVIVRSKPDVTGKTVTQLQDTKGTIIYYRPSTEKGWYEVSLNGDSAIGYLPAKYITK